jgi:hypothetical protein
MIQELRRRLSQSLPGESLEGFSAVSSVISYLRKEAEAVLQFYRAAPVEDSAPHSPNQSSPQSMPQRPQRTSRQSKPGQKEKAAGEQTTP